MELARKLQAPIVHAFRGKEFVEHFAASRELTEGMIRSKAIAVAYETVEESDGTLPLLVPMSEVAGRMAVQEGAKFLKS